LPKVSAIIPTHDRAGLLGRAIESVLAQTVWDLELIVVDDGSTDATDKVVAAFTDPRVRYLRHETNRGCYAAQNTGLREARGEFIAILGSDDEWLPEFLERQLPAFDDPAVGVSGCGWIAVTPECPEGVVCIPRLDGPFEEVILGRWVFGVGVSVIRKGALDAAGPWDEEMPASADWDMWIRLSRICRVVIRPEPLIRLDCGTTVSVSKNMAWVEKGREMLMKKHGAAIRANPKRHACFHFITGHCYLENGHMRKGRRELLSAIAITPANWRYWAYLAASLLGHRGYRRVFGLKTRLKAGPIQGANVLPA